MKTRDKIGNFMVHPVTVITAIAVSFILSVITSNIGTFLGFAVILFTVWAIRWKWSFFGIQRNPFFKTLAKALLYTVGIIVVNDLIVQPLIEHFFGMIDLSSFDWLEGNWISFIIFLLIMWVVAAFGEEFLYRGYMTKQLARIFGDSGKAWLIAILISSVIFGFAHTYQGTSGIISTAFVALIFGFIFYHNKTNLWVCVLTHGIYDVFGITLLFLGKYNLTEWALEHIYFFL